jgi:hypothetical protein
MQLKLIAVYLDQSQLEYIVAIKNYLLQENFNFNFEYFDSQSDFAQHHDVSVYPTFFLTKNNFISNTIEGKIDFSELKERLLSINYVYNS